MKRYFSIGVLIALAALALGSCSKDIEEDVTLEERSLSHSVSFNVSMSDQTRTGLAFKFVPNWIKTDEKNNVHLFETNQGETIEGEDVKMEIEEGRHNEVAHFSAEFSNMTIIVNPPSNTSALTRAGDDGFYYTGIVAQKLDNKFIVPAVQYPDEETLIDPNADFLVGDGRKSYSVSQSEKAVDLYFLRPVAASRLAIMNIGQGSVIKTVKITSTAKLTGSASYDAINFSTGAVTFDANSGETTITLDYGAGVSIPDEATFYAYFISLTGPKPITSIEVTTDTHVYTKTVGKTLTFKTDDFKNIAVDMSKVTPTPVNSDQPKEQNITFHKNNGTITSDSFTLGSGTYELPTLDGVAEGATVSWSLSESNPEGVATLNHVGNTWTLTPVKAGIVTVSVTAGAVEGFKETTKFFVLTVTDAATQELSFTPESLTVTLGDDEFTEPVLSGAINAVTYSIDHTNVATIDENTGKLTLVAAGTATVTATAAAGTTGGTYYAEATATYELTVNEPAPVVTTTYTLVNKQEDMVDGNYLIVAADDDKVFNGSGDFQGGFATISTTEAITLSGETITISGEKAAYEFAFAKSGNGYTITGAQGQIVAAAHSNASTSTETYITFAETGGSVFLLRGKLASDDKALLFSTTRGTSSEEYIYFNTSNTIFKIGGSGSTRGAHFYFAGTRTAQTVDFDDAYTYDLYNNNGWGGTVPTPSGDYHTELVYESSNTNVVYYDNGLKIAAGARKGDTATVTVTAPASAEYLSATATFTVTIADTTPTVMATYTKVANAADVEVGAKYLLVYEGTQTSSGNTKPKVYNPVLNTAGTQFAKDTTAALDVTIVNGVIESSDFNDCHFTLEAGYYLKGDKADMYIYPGTSGSSSVMLAEATASHALTIAINSGIAEIANGGRYLVWSTSSHYFSCNSDVSGQYSTGICLYKLDDGRTPQALTFSADEAEYDLGTSTWTTAVPTLSGAQTSPLNWSSSDEDVATVDASGTVTAVAKGTATISVTAPASETYKSGYASFTVRVVNSNVPTYYKADAIVAGEQYLIVSNDHALRNNNNSIATVSTPVDANGQIKYDAPTDVLWTATDDGTGFMLKNGSSYLNVRSSSLTIRTSTSSQSAYNYWTYNAEASQLVINGTYLYYNNNTFALSSTAQNAALYTTTPPKTPQSLSYTPAVASYDLYTKQWSESMPTLGGDYHTTVTYESSDDAVVEVVGGVLTPKAVGTATITATAPADETYKAATATCTITVKDSTPVIPDPGAPTYTQITSASQLVSGATYLIVSSDYNNYNGKDHQTLFAGDEAGTAVDVTASSGTISGDYSAYEFVISASGSDYTLYGPSGYVTGNSSDSYSRYIQVSTSVVKMSLTDAATLKAATSTDGQVADAFYFYYTKSGSKEVLYLNKDGKYKIGGSGRQIGVYLYMKDGSGTTPEPPTPSTVSYTKVDAVTSGATYLIVSHTDAVAMVGNGTTTNDNVNYTAVSPSSGVISGAAADFEECEAVITEESSGAYSIYFTKLGKYFYYQNSQSGLYYGNHSSSNDFSLSTVGSGDYAGSFLFTKSSKYLYYNDTFFKIGGSGSTKGVHLYKKN